MRSTSASRRRRRLWRFGGAEFDEASWALRVDGGTVALEGKPLEVLHELLLRAGEVVTKEEILDSVWPDVTVVEGSLATAISKLRKVLGRRQDNIIETVPRVGYRLACPVRVESVESPLAPRFSFAPGDTVPGRSQWVLAAPLGDTGSEDVWLARHTKTGEQRVFKFADAPDRLRALKREAALSRLLFAGLGGDAPIPAIHEWNFDAPPYFLESAFGGRDLTAWAAETGGLSAVPLAERLAIAAQICRAVERIHAMGVLHKDLKPANILIADGAQGRVVRLVDFGSGRLLDDAVLDNYRITNPGSLDAELARDEPRSGTLAYRAPELVGEALPTVKSDIYALGLILCQLAAGDFDKSLAPGWERAVADPLLREDIGEAAAGAPEHRLDSAGALAARIERLDERCAAAAQEAERAAEVARLRQAEERRAIRRPWVRAAVASLAAGFVGASALSAYALHQRHEAVTARETADRGYSFIADDVLGSPDPAKASADETAVDMIKRASGTIDRRFAGQPGLAARLHLSIARALHRRSDFDAARGEYAAADRLFAKNAEAQSDEAALARLGRIHMDAVSGQPGRVDEGRRLLAQEKQRLGRRGERGRIGFALAQAEGAINYIADARIAEAAFARAARIAEAPGSDVPATERLKARSSLLLTLLRQGRAAEAEPIARAIVAESIRVRGANDPDTLVAQHHLLTCLSMEGKVEEALRGSEPLLAAMTERFGPDHRFTLGLRSTRFESYSVLGRYAEAAAEAERVWKGAAALAGPRSHQALAGQNDYAAALCRTPDSARGLAVAQDALAGVRGAFGEEYSLTHVLRYYTAECLLARHRPAEAEALLAGIDPRKMTELTGQAEFGALVDLALAETALARGDRRQARARLDAALPVLGNVSDRFIKARLDALARTLAA